MKKKLKKSQEGGNIQWDYNPNDLLKISDEEKSNNLNIVRPLVYKPQGKNLKVKDNRKINATSGKPINPNKDLMSGKFDSERINKIIQFSKLYGADPYDLLALDLQETHLGTSGKEGDENIGHTLGSESDIKTPSKFIDTYMKYKYNQKDPDYDNFVRTYIDKVNESKRLGLKKQEDILQTYNGRGYVYPKTENEYHGYDMNSIYGVPLGTSGINMAKNPLYGKRIIDLKENILKKSPVIKDAVETVYQNGGITSKQDNTRIVIPSIPANNSKKAINQSKKIVGNNILAQKLDEYFNPIVKNISSGDLSLDLLYRNKWLMDAPIVGNMIKDKAYDVALNSAGQSTTGTHTKNSKKYIGADVSDLARKLPYSTPNLVDQYFGKAQLPKSLYKPTSDYLEFLPSVSIKGDFDKYNNGMDMSDIINDISSEYYKTKGTSDIKDYSEPRYKGYNSGDEAPLMQKLGVDLGGHKTGIAFDKDRNLPYISISDAWDFSPSEYSKTYNGDLKSDHYKETYIQSSLMHKAGNPFKVYDRFYFDPKTKKYISNPDKKQKGGQLKYPVINSIPESTSTSKRTIAKIKSKESDITPKLRKYLGDEEAEVFSKLLIENGNPSITRGTPWFNAMASFNPFQNNITIDKEESAKSKNKSDYEEEEYFYLEGNRDDAIKEITHAKQFKNGILKPALKWLGNDLPAYIKGQDPYSTPGTLEHEAHSIIEPEMMQNYKSDVAREKYKNSHPEAIQKINPSALSKITNRRLKKGGTVTNTGYLNNSPDRFNDYNIIPSNQITMQNVDYPIYGIDDQGNEQMMFPGQDYEFPGNYVTEYPMKNKENTGQDETGKPNFLKKLKAQMGMEVPAPGYDENINPFFNYDPGYNPDTASKSPVKKDIKEYLLGNKLATRMSSNLMNNLIDPSSLYNGIGYLDSGINYLNNNSRNNRREDQLISERNSDNLFPVQPGNDRGEYVVNGTAYGQFRPDQIGAQSPYGMEGRYFQNGGSYTTPRGNVITDEDLNMFAKNSGMRWGSKEEYGTWMDQGLSPMTTRPSITYPFGKKGETMTQAEWDYSRTKRGYPDVYSDRVQGTDNFIPGEIYANEVRNDITEYRSKQGKKMAYGGQNSGFALDLNPNVESNPTTTKGMGKINRTLGPEDEEVSNIEAELGETIFGDFDGDGINEHMNIGGKRHSQGGTPLVAPPESFIFSDTRKMKIGGDILTDFGKPENTKKKYTPADLAKQYDVNKYKAIIDDPDADPIKKRTAEMMIENFNNKLGQLALAQESIKGFPDGIPTVALPYLMTQVGPEGVEELEGQGSQEQNFAEGGTYDPWNDYTDPYPGGKTKKGTITPTGKKNPYNRPKSYLQEWEKIFPGISKMDNAKAQGMIYDYNLTTNPDSIRDMWTTYGNTAKGLRDRNTKDLSNNGKFDPTTLDDKTLRNLRSAYTDGYFGVRQMDPNSPEMLPPITPNAPSIPGVPPSKQAPPVTEIPTSTDPNPFLAKKGEQAPSDFWTQDKINVASALGNRANLNKYMPWAAPITGVQADPTFYDPNRELASNSEMANTEMMYNNQFSGPQSVGVRNSAVSGNSATNAANILGRYNNLNVGVANDFAGQNAQFTNQLLSAQAQRANQLYQGTVTANQQFDNSKSQANDVIRKNLLSGLDNKQKTQWINTWYPQYDIDPSTGYVNFAEGTGYSRVTPGSSQSSSTTGNYIQMFKEIKKQNPDMSDDVIKEHLKRLLPDARNTVTSDGDVRSTSRGAVPPMLEQLMKFQR